MKFYMETNTGNVKMLDEVISVGGSMLVEIWTKAVSSKTDIRLP